MAVRALVGIRTTPQDTHLVYDMLRHLHTIQPDVPKLNPKMLLNGPHNIIIDEVSAENEVGLYLIVARIRGIQGIEEAIPNIILQP